MMIKRQLNFLKALLTVCAVFQCFIVFAQSENEKSITLFLIGNSFSQNATKYLPELAKDGGFDLTIGRAELPGCSLKRHWDLVEAAEANDPKGKAYKGKSLKELLSEGKWDVVTIQQASIFSGDVNTYRPYAKKLYDYIKKIQPDAEVVIHQTWPYRSDAAEFSQIAEREHAKDATEMWQKSRAAYHTIASEIGIRIIPVGDAFREASIKKKTAFKVDTKFDNSTAVKSKLPNQKNSLHVGYHYNKEKLYFDSHHANDAGCYLGGLVWYTFIFEASSVDINFKPASVDESFARQLKKIAEQVVSAQK